MSHLNGTQQGTPGERHVALSVLLFLWALLQSVLRAPLIAITAGLLLSTQSFSGGITDSAARRLEGKELLRQKERERFLKGQEERTPDVRLGEEAQAEIPPPLPNDEEPCFVINKIILGGEDADRFQWALKAIIPAENTVIGSCLGSRAINLLMQRLQNNIIQRGYITTRVLAAPQDLREGTLLLTLIPGRIREIRLTEDAAQRATLWNALPIEHGDLLNLRAIEQGLENLKRLPTAQADIKIIPAAEEEAKPGKSDLAIDWQQQVPPLRLSLSLDDSGTAATGKYQGSATFSFDNPFLLNDLFYVSLSRDLGGGDPGSRGTRGIALHYSVPWDYWLLSVNANRHTYHQTVAGINQSYLYHGESSNMSIRLARMIYRSATGKSTLSFLAWAKSTKNFIDDTEIMVQRRRMAGFELGLGHREFIGAATLNLDLAYRRGTGALNSLHAPEEAFDEGTARPEILTASVQFNTPLLLRNRKPEEQRYRYISTLRAQYNMTPLVPLDRFSIGGRYTVRGFDGERTLSAERGILWRNELEARLYQSPHKLYLGMDYGTVSGKSARLLLGRNLLGMVLGLRGTIKGLHYDAFIGGPLDQPRGFTRSRVVGGFSLNYQF